MSNPPENITYEIKIKGLVQGVGFRPFIYILAEKFNIKGWVENRNDGVLVRANTDPKTIKLFIEAVKNERPVASTVETISVSEKAFEFFDRFSIKKSESNSDVVTEVSPDIAVCNDCLEDIKNQTHRKMYPFTNCTNCGPRFTIIKDLPYDREKTTMHEFTMCETCMSEYSDIYNRRFHAQPVACNTCGPYYTLHFQNNKITDIQKIISLSSDLIQQGKIIAIKGLGGYHIMCDAHNESAVTQLRKLKNRDKKAFAVMFRDIETLENYAFISEKEKEELLSWQRPILLLKIKKFLAPSVTQELNKIGVMLPYMPFHYMLLNRLKTDALVLTSGNYSDEPIITDNDVALNKFLTKTDAVITYNRKIHNRTDDSVGIVVNNKLRLLRRSRGYAPASVAVSFNVEGIFATGAEFVNCFCIGKGNRAFMSQHIGDLKNLETFEFYKESYELYKRLFRFSPKYIVCDLHPDYLSSKFAEEIIKQHSDIELIKVQHHHAHIASCMAENNLNEKLIGISFDGLGLGTDGNIWGGEFFINDLSDFQRFTHFEYIPVSGGDYVSKQPWRSAVSYLFHYFGEQFFSIGKSYIENNDIHKIKMYTNILKSGFNIYKTSSAGRLFDAVASLIGLIQESDYHAEAPMLLESVVDEAVTDSYSYGFYNRCISFKPMFESIINDLNNSVSKSVIAAKFHNTLVDLVVETSLQMRNETGLNTIAVSGGTFQNKILLEKVERSLFEHKFDVFTSSKIPSNDGGIALGQLIIAAAKKRPFI
jgi:hydrogenase maturation protein HypF